jgi:hypothetical protein
MPIFRVYIRRRTTLPPSWDWSQTVVSKDESSALQYSYASWRGAGPVPPPPPLSECGYNVIAAGQGPRRAPPLPES